MNRCWIVLALMTTYFSCRGGNAQQPEPTSTIQFNRDIRPILSDQCFPCHGPDQAKREGELRLDIEEFAKQSREGKRAITPGHPETSELVRRITTNDSDARMPPADSGHRLTDHDKEKLQEWIRQGARWEEHWAFLPPKRLVPKAIPNLLLSQNAIDAWVGIELEKSGLTPSPHATRETLIRRVTFDLTGLPPSIQEIDDFLSDDSPNAYEDLVERLLASPRFGERMASRWLDAARYADTNGYQSDGERFMWRWRDWVIEALNANIPFHQFTIEQLAGDLLPSPTFDQRLATGFHRNHRGNGEGGIIPEEYAVEYVVDRVDTTATVWLGLTLGCVRCHDHKFDPFTQEEYYQLYAFFNNIPERGKAVKFGNSPPLISAPTREQQRAHRELQRSLIEAQDRYFSLQSEIEKSQSHWEATNLSSEFKSLSNVGDPRLEWTPEAFFRLNERDDPTSSPIHGSAPFDGLRVIQFPKVGAFGFYDAFSLTAWIRPEEVARGTIFSRMIDLPEGSGYSVRLVDGKIEIDLVKRWLDDAIRVRSHRSLHRDEWSHIAVVYDASRFASGVHLYLDGKKEPLEIVLDELNQSFETTEPFRIGAGHGPLERFRGHIAKVGIYAGALGKEEIASLSVPESIEELVRIPVEQRSEAQKIKLRYAFLEHGAPPSIRERYLRWVALKKELHDLEHRFPTSMVMEERETRRPTHVLIRGVYHDRGPEVRAGVPQRLNLGDRHQSPQISTRLDLARWIVHPSHPLTARVAVNRAWQLHFGTGLVKTVDDFGSQGEWPSHPELLDWLATEFVRTGWDVKDLHRKIVCSAAYRQSSKMAHSSESKDAENRKIHRGPALRNSAEMIRDASLFVSGLLVETQGGPSVKPYQPEGLWKDLSGEEYKQDHGEKLYRRSLYTFWKRTNAPPSMMVLDAAGRETCIVRETRTNTPLQALTLMNDIAFVEAARMLAERMLNEGGVTDHDRLRWGFRTCLTREPSNREMELLKKGLIENRNHFRLDRKSALELVSTGESPRDARLSVSEHAAYTVAASLLMNLDEFMTKR